MNNIKYRAWVFDKFHSFKSREELDQLKKLPMSERNGMDSYQSAWVMGEVQTLYLSKKVQKARVKDNSVSSKYHDYEIGDNCVLMRSTGVVDSEGQEIFEGDIIEYWYNLSRYKGREPETTFKGKVVFADIEIEKGYEPESRHVGFVLQCKNLPKHGGEIWYTEFTENMKVIGNIYENPELANDL